MAGDVERLSIQIDLETGSFKQQVSAINSEIKNLDKSFKQLGKGLDDNSYQKFGLTIDKNRKQIELMNKELEVQQRQQQELTRILEEQMQKRQQMQQSNQQDTQAYRANEQNIARNQSALLNLTASMERNRTSISNWADEIIQAGEGIQALDNATMSIEQQLSQIDSSARLSESEFNRLNSTLGESGSFFQRLGNNMQQLGSKMQSNTQRISAYENEIESLRTTQQRLQQSQSEYTRDIEQTRSRLSSATSQYGETSSEVSELTQELYRLQDGLRQCNSELESNEASLNDYQTQVNNLTADNNRMAQQLRQMPFEEMGNRIQSVGRGISNVGRTLTQNVTMPMMAGAIAVSKFTMDYQNGLNKISSISGISGKALQSYGEDIIKISDTTGVAVTDLQESVYQAISGGVEASKATTFVADATKLAVGGFAEATDTIDLLTSAYNIYGQEIGSVSQLSDKFIATQNLGKTTVGELATEMGQAMNMAGTYGVNLDNVLASYAKLTAGGTGTAEATTGITRAIEELGTSGSKVGDILQEKTGKNFKQLMEDGSSLGDVLGVLGEYASEAGIGVNELFSSGEAGLAVLGLLKEEGKDFNSILKEIGNSSGLADEAFNKRQESAGQKFMVAINKLKNSLLDFGIAMTPVIEQIADFISNVADKFNELDDGTKEAIMKFAGLAMAIGPVLSMIGSLTTGVGAVVKAFGLLSGSSTAISAIGTSAVGATAGVAGLGTTLAGLVFNPVTIVAGIALIATAVGDSESALASLQNNFGAVGYAIGAVCEHINGVVQLTFGNLFTVLGGVGKAIGAVFRGDFQEIDDICRETWANVKSNTSEALSDISGETSNAIKSLKNMSQQELKGVENAFDYTMKNLPKLTAQNLDTMASNFAGTFKGMSDDSLEIMRGTSDNMAVLLHGINESMNNEEATAKFKKNLDTMLQSGVDASALESDIKNALDTINNNIGDGAVTMKQKSTDLFNSFKDAQKSGMKNALSDTAQMLGDWTNEQLEQQRSLGDTWSNTMDGITEDMTDQERYNKLKENFDAMGIPVEEWISKLREEASNAKEISHDMATSFDEIPKEVQTELKTNFPDASEEQLLNINNILSQFPPEVQSDLKLNYADALSNAENFEQFINNLPEEKRVEILSNTQFVGSLSPEQLKYALDSLPSEKVVQVLANLQQQGELTTDQLTQYLQNLPEEKRAEVIALITGKEELSSVEEILNEIPPETLKKLGITVNGEGEVEATKESIEAVKDKDVNVNANTTGVEEVKEAGSTVEKLPSVKEVTVNFIQSGANLLDKIGEWIGSKTNTTASLTVTVTGQDAVQRIKTAMDSIKSKSATITANANSQAVTNMKVAIDRIQPKTVNIQANSSNAISKINNVKTGLTGIKDKTVNILANSSNAISKINNVKGQLAGIKDKTVNIKVNAGNAISVINSVKSALNGVRSKTVNVRATKTITTIEKTQQASLLQSTPNPMLAKAMPTSIPLTDTPSLLSDESSNVLKARATSNTPISMGGLDTLDSLKFNVELLQELQNRINKVNNSLDIMDKKQKRAIGEEKIRYLRETNQLYAEQQALQQDLINKLNTMKNTIKNELQGKGFGFTGDGNFTNYEEQLLAMERHYESLQEASEKASKAQSDYTGDDEATKNRLKKASEDASKAEKDYNENLSNTKSLLSEYISIVFSDIPNAQSKFEDLANSITDNNEEIKDMQEEVQKLAEQLKREKWELRLETDYTSVENDVKQITNELKSLETQMKNLEDEEKIPYLEKQIELYKQYKQELKEQLDYMIKVQDELKNTLASQGFSFDASGDITNLTSQMQYLKDSLGEEEFKRIQETVNGYLDLLLDKVPDIKNEFDDVNNSIKDTSDDIQDIYDKLEEKHKETLEDNLDTTEKIEKQITEIYKKEIEKQIKAMEEATKKKVDALNKEKLAYQNARKEQDYKDEYNEQLKSIEEIQKQIDMFSRDDSVTGKKKLQDLLKQLEEENKQLQNMTQDKIDEQVENMFDDEANRLDEQGEQTIKNLEEKFSDANIAKLISDSLSSGLFEGVDGQFSSLKDSLLEYAEEAGDLWGVMGSTVRDELITNLEIARDTMMDIADINKELGLENLIDLSNINYRSAGFAPNASQISNTTNTNKSVTINSNPTFNINGVNGEIDYEAIQEMIDKSNDEMLKDMLKYI